MKYELTREQISHIFHLGQVWSKDSVKGVEKVDFYLDSLLKENDSPQIGESFKFKGVAYRCVITENMIDTCQGCCFLYICDKYPGVGDSPACFEPHRIFKRI